MAGTLKGSKANVEALTNDFGYKYEYIKRTKDYSHPSVIYFYNNKITNYIEGVTFDEKMLIYN